MTIYIQHNAPGTFAEHISNTISIYMRTENDRSFTNVLHMTYITDDEGQAISWFREDFGLQNEHFEIEYMYPANTTKENADIIAKALRNFAKSDAAIENFTDYLAKCFTHWFALYANTPDGLADELYQFSKCG